MPRIRISSFIIHLFVWLALMTFPLIFRIKGETSALMDPVFIRHYIQFCLIYIVVFYIHAYYLFPVFYFKKKYTIYVLSVIVLFVGALTFQPYGRMLRDKNHPPLYCVKASDHPIRKRLNRHLEFDSILMLITVLGMGSAIRSVRELRLTDTRVLLSETKQANTTVSFNNEITTEGSQKLADIVHYTTTNGAARGLVPLSVELTHISDYIELQKPHLDKTVTLSYLVSGNPDGHQIIPLTLITFIENIFKYEQINHTSAPITISIDIMDDRIDFYTQHQLADRQKKNTSADSDFKNTRQRLEQLYPGQFTLKTKQKKDVLTVNLILFY
ncbi:hypothetical protein H7F33_06055 [Pedobacter sp. PAMC26386]|nr:hypothetical protein H7F33_06055 [Pedobacter sp. PAMC26386]